MTINKILILYILLFFFIGCKKENDTIDKNITIKTNNNVAKNTTNITNKSFVISCGSGCAMTYSLLELTGKKPALKAKLNVDMYIDEQLSDSYSEIYTFNYDNQGKIKSIHLEGSDENVLETFSPDAQQSFKEFAENLETEKPKPTTSLPTNTYIYNSPTNPNKVSYQYIETKSVKGLEEYSCGEKNTRYISLPKKEDILVILVLQDCGDFNYRYFLLTLRNNNVIDKLYVEGEWYEPDDKENKETTTFSIDDKYNIVVKTQTSTLSESKAYIIKKDGKIYEK